MVTQCEWIHQGPRICRKTNTHIQIWGWLFCVIQVVLFVMCTGNELFFCLLYVLYHIEEPAGKMLLLLFMLLPRVSRFQLRSDPLSSSLALLSAGSLWCHLPAEGRHQPAAPCHCLAEHGRPWRRWAGEEHQGTVREEQARASGTASVRCFVSHFLICTMTEFSNGISRSRGES